MFSKIKCLLLLWLFISCIVSVDSYAQNNNLSVAERDALQKANKIYEELEAGADFESLAGKYSDDLHSGSRGGDMGFAKKGQMVPPFEKAALLLKPGDISKPVKSEFGYHIIQMVERREEEYHCRHILVRVH